MATIQEKKTSFLNKAKQKIAEIGYSMVDQRDTGLSVFNDAYYIDELLSGIRIVESTDCNTSEDDTQKIIDYLDYKYSLTNIPINPNYNPSSGEALILSGQSLVGPKGEKGDKGDAGNDGYTPVKDVDYFDGADGADGTTPVKDVDYFDGADGADGYTPVKDIDYFDGADGLNGWSPVLALVTDGNRRVHQVVNWVGGTTSKPSTGSYVGESDFVVNISDATDVRGTSGDKGDVGPQGIKGESGYGIVDPIQASTTTNLVATNVSGVLTADANGALPSQDGVAMSVGDRLLVQHQTTLPDNGLFEISDLGDGSNPYILTRTSDFNTTSLLRKFPQCFVESGSTYESTNWTLFDDRTTLILELSDIVFKEQAHPLQDTEAPSPGDVTGPASSTNEIIPVFDGATGKLIKESQTLINSGTDKIHTPTGLVSKNYSTTEISFSVANAIRLITDGIEMLRVINDAFVEFVVNEDNQSMNFIVKTPLDDHAINVNATNESVGIFQSSPNANTALDIGGSRAIIIPRLSTTQRNSLTASDGMQIYNTTTGKYEFRQNGSWDSIPTGIGVSRQSGTLSSWTLDAGDIYYEDFVHNIGTLDVVESIRDNVTNEKVQVHKVKSQDVNTTRVYIKGNTAVLRITVV